MLLNKAEVVFIWTLWIYLIFQNQFGNLIFLSLPKHWGFEFRVME